MTSEVTLSAQDVDRIAKRLAELTQIQAPNEHTLWTTEQVATYLGQDTKHVSDRVVAHPSFPAPFRPPSTQTPAGRPRWNAMEVIEWVKKHRERTKV